MYTGGHYSEGAVNTSLTVPWLIVTARTLMLTKMSFFLYIGGHYSEVAINKNLILFVGARGDVSDEDSPPPRRPPAAANALSNLWKRSRRGGSGAASSDDDDQGCFLRRQPGKYYTTEEYKIETTVSVTYGFKITFIYRSRHLLWSLLLESAAYKNQLSKPQLQFPIHKLLDNRINRLLESK